MLFPTQKISEDFQQCLEDQLQGAIETCGQLDHVQKFIAWATTHHCRGPVLFSRALVLHRDLPLLTASKAILKYSSSDLKKLICSVDGGSSPILKLKAVSMDSADNRR